MVSTRAFIANEAGKHVDTHKSLRDNIAGMNNGDIKLAVGHRGVGRYKGIIAILRSVAYHHQEGTVGNNLAVGPR